MGHSRNVAFNDTRGETEHRMMKQCFGRLAVHKAVFKGPTLAQDLTVEGGIIVSLTENADKLTTSMQTNFLF